jgi:hypothetical protein
MPDVPGIKVQCAIKPGPHLFVGRALFRASRIKLGPTGQRQGGVTCSRRFTLPSPIPRHHTLHSTPLHPTPPHSTPHPGTNQRKPPRDGRLIARSRKDELRASDATYFRSAGNPGKPRLLSPSRSPATSPE